MLHPLDDQPIHQTPEPLAHPATGDRNFYDRYYFNLHNSSGELFMVMGMGQYPNLAVQDAFVALRRGGMHRVVRASRELDDRADTTVGPIRIEVIEGLKEGQEVVVGNYRAISRDLGDGAPIVVNNKPAPDTRS